MLLALAATATLSLSPAAVPSGGLYTSTIAGADLAQHCAPGASALAADFCTGYATATYDALSVSRQICPGPSSSTEALIRIARDYVGQHPEFADYAATFVMANAFREAYPCSAR